MTAELPMLALILHLALMPIPIGSSPSLRWTVLAGMIIRPRATSDRTSSGSSLSRRATCSISLEIVPCRAISICVMLQTSVNPSIAATSFVAPASRFATWTAFSWSLWYNNFSGDR